MIFKKERNYFNHSPLKKTVEKSATLIADNIFSQISLKDPLENLPPELNGWVKIFLSFQVEGVKAPKTFKAMKQDLNRFVGFYLETLPDADIRRWTLRTTTGFIEFLKGEDLKPKTIKRYLASIRTFSKWVRSVRPDLFPFGDPTKGVKGPTQESMRPKGLTNSQVRRFLDAAYLLICQNNPDERVAKVLNKEETWYAKAHRKTRRPFRDYAILMLLLNGGLRRQEICDLTLNQLQGKHLLNVKCKGDQYRDLLIGEETLKALDVYLQEERTNDRLAYEGSEAFFLPSSSKKHRNKTGHLSTRSINEIIKRIAEVANKGCSKEDAIKAHPNMFRHTHAYQLLKNDRGLPYLQKRLGHKNLNFIALYTQMPEEEELELLNETEFR